jgi:hypothetical protein
VNESESVGVSVVARLVGSDVVVIRNWDDDGPDAIVNVRLVIAALASFDSVTLSELVAPIAVLPNGNDVVVVLLTASVTGGVTVSDTGIASVNGAPFHVPSMSSVSVYVCATLGLGAGNNSARVSVPLVVRLVGGDVVVIVKGDEVPEASENERPLRSLPATSERVTVSMPEVPTFVAGNASEDPDVPLSPTGPGVAVTGASCVNACAPSVPVITSVSLHVCCTFGARNDSVSVAVPPAAIDVGPDTENGDDDPDANE